MAEEEGSGREPTAYEWSDKVLLPLRSQPSSLDWSVISSQPAGVDFDAEALDLSVSSEAGLRRYRARVDAKRPSCRGSPRVHGKRGEASCNTPGPDDAGEEGSVRAVISLHPILAVRNALPETVTLSLLACHVVDGSETALSTRALCAGARLSIYSADRRTALGLVLQTARLERVASPALIFHPQGEPLSNEIQLLGSQRGGASAPLRLQLDYVVSPWGDTTVVVYPSYVIRNLSGMHLIYGAVAADVAGLAAAAGTAAVVPAAGQEVGAVAEQASVLGGLLALAMGSGTGHDSDDEQPTGLKPSAVSPARTKPADLPRARDGGGGLFSFSCGGEGGGVDGKLCLSVDGCVWSGAVDLQQPEGTSCVIALAVGQWRAAMQAGGAAFLPTRRPGALVLVCACVGARSGTPCDAPSVPGVARLECLVCRCSVGHVLSLASGV